MAVKDITEKILLSYTDVFADVVNGLLFKGEQIILYKNRGMETIYQAGKGCSM